ncbi:MAG: hypothetical protein J6J90_07535, partial [Angelakisella sp.]|nr:hypothetical protein [Angelakisella sp.]
PALRAGREMAEACRVRREGKKQSRKKPSPFPEFRRGCLSSCTNQRADFCGRYIKPTKIKNPQGTPCRGEKLVLNYKCKQNMTSLVYAR